MPFEDLSKNELIAILELIEKAQRSSGAMDMQKLILKAAALVEAEYAVCGLMRSGQDGAPEVAAYINGNYPEEWVRRYLEKGYHLKDPIVRFHANYAFTQTWNVVFRQFDDNEAMLVVNEASDFGLKFGLTGALYVPEINNIALFTFAGRTDQFGPHQKRITDILSMHFTSALAGCAGASIIGAGRGTGEEGYPIEREGKAW